MSLPEYLYNFLGSMNIIAAAALCYYPFVHQNRFSWKVINISTALFFFSILPINLVAEKAFSLGYNGTFPLILSISFIFFCVFFKAGFYKKFFVFTLASATIAFVSNIANGFDAYLHPDSGVDNFSSEAALFQAALSLGLALVAYYPSTKYFSIIIDSFNSNFSWMVVSSVNCAFLGFNLLIIPRDYSLLKNNRLHNAFWGLVLGMMGLMILLCIVFTYLVRSFFKSNAAKEKLRILEMQESMYERQQQYMDDTRRERHDFRQTIRTLTTMANEDDFQGIKNYLESYSENVPENVISRFTENIAVNALLNYYKDSATDYSIDLSWEVDLPKDLGDISNSDFCSIIGNVLDNAIIACKNVDTEDRFIDLAIRCENESTIYIVAANSFDGHVKEKGGTYQSTHRHGSGIGLESIKVTSEKYGGEASFSHEENEFYSEIVLNMFQNL